MSNHFLNPNYKPHMDLGDNGPADDAEWAIWKGYITDWLDERAGTQELVLEECRAVSNVFLDQRVWNQASSEVGIQFIFEVADPE